MTPKAQRIAIAEACGIAPAWTAAAIAVEKCRKACAATRRDSYSGWAAIEKLEKAEKNPDYLCPIPDYLTDLNAMHEAEKVLTKEQQRSFALILQGRQMGSMDYLAQDFRAIHSKPAQRAEAFLRTLNLWTE